MSASWNKRNRRMLLSLTALTAGMLGLAYASAPLYRLFCQVTGFGGATIRAEAAPSQSGTRLVTVRFDANTDPALPWKFEPMQPSVTAKLGETMLIFYRAKNQSDQPVTGMATYNVTPLKTGGIFTKLACFCFEQQTLQPGEEVEMPVSFFIDPTMNEDKTLNDVKTITLSYTFFRAKMQTAAVREGSPASGDFIGKRVASLSFPAKYDGKE